MCAVQHREGGLGKAGFQRPDCSRLRREIGGEGRQLSGSLAVVREERKRATAGGRSRIMYGW